MQSNNTSLPTILIRVLLPPIARTSHILETLLLYIDVEDKHHTYAMLHLIRTIVKSSSSTHAHCTFLTPDNCDHHAQAQSKHLHHVPRLRTHDPCYIAFHLIPNTTANFEDRYDECINHEPLLRLEETSIREA